MGSGVVRSLLDAGYDVRALVWSSSDLRNLEDMPVDVAHGDLTDSVSVKKAMNGVRVSVPCGGGLPVVGSGSGIHVSK